MASQAYLSGLETSRMAVSFTTRRSFGCSDKRPSKSEMECWPFAVVVAVSLSIFRFGRMQTLPFRPAGGVHVANKKQDLMQGMKKTALARYCIGIAT